MWVEEFFVIIQQNAHQAQTFFLTVFIGAGGGVGEGELWQVAEDYVESMTLDLLEHAGLYERNRLNQNICV
jgi:hypothetical protein